MQTGHLELSNTYDHATGVLTGHIELNFSFTPPHLVLLEGSALLHTPVVNMASRVIHLDIKPYVLEDRRFRRDQGKKSKPQLVESNKRWNDWGRQYYPANLGNAYIVLNEKDEDKLSDLTERIIQSSHSPTLPSKEPHRDSQCHRNRKSIELYS